MPRKAKRIPQQVGAPVQAGNTYNRTDLATQPVRTSTGNAYGEGIKREAAQQAAPLPQMPGIEQIMQAAQGMQFPEGQGLAAPTMNPTEPVTAGMPIGRGPGPEVLQRPPGAPTAAQTLAKLADALADTGLAELARIAEMQGA